MKHMTKAGAAFGALAGLALAPLLMASAAQADKLSMRSLTIGTNPAGSTYFLIAGGLARTFQTELGVRSTAQPHSGSSVYIPLMDSGEITLGLNNSLDSNMSFQGQKPYPRAMSNLRKLARIWVLPYAFVVRGDSGIRTLTDLKGKRVNVNFRTNVSLGDAGRAMLATADMTEDDVQSTLAGGVVAGIDMVVEGRSDATQVAIGAPQVVRAHTTLSGGMFVLPLGPKATDEFLHERMPGLYTLRVKPSPTMQLVDEEKTIAAFDTYLNISGSVSPEDGYLLAKTLHTHWAQLQKDYAPLRSVAQNQLAPANAVIPYHPGAERFYKEVGLWSDDHTAQQGRIKR